MEQIPEISGILGQFETVKSFALSTYKKIKDSSSTYLYSGWFGEVEAVIDEYSDAFVQFNSLKNKIKFDIYLKSISISRRYETQDAKKAMLRIVVQCEKAIGLLKKIEAPIPQFAIETLGSLREELKKISDSIEDLNYFRNLDEAIKEYENGHYLASALISSRVIVYLLDRVSGETIKEKIQTLKRDGLLEGKRRDVKESIIKSLKLARNFTSHDIQIFPSPTESLSLLSDSITLLKMLSKIA